MADVVLREDQLWVGEMRGVVVRGQPLLVVRTDAEVCVFRDRCPHQGYPLSRGELRDGVLTCRAHHHTFDVATGRGKNPRTAELCRVPSRVEDGQLLVELSSRKEGAP